MRVREGAQGDDGARRPARMGETEARGTRRDGRPRGGDATLGLERGAGGARASGTRASGKLWGEPGAAAKRMPGAEGGGEREPAGDADRRGQKARARATGRQAGGGERGRLRQKDGQERVRWERNGPGSNKDGTSKARTETSEGPLPGSRQERGGVEGAGAELAREARGAAAAGSAAPARPMPLPHAHEGDDEC